MTTRPLRRILAAALIVCLQAMVLPAMATDEFAGLTGALLSSADRAPLADARLHAADPETGRIYSSTPSSADGAFDLPGLPPASYELAVEHSGGLFVVPTPVRVAPGRSRHVDIAVSDPRRSGEIYDAQGKSGKNIWNHPVTASLIVFASAIVVGYAVNELTEDDDENAVSPF